MNIGARSIHRDSGTPYVIAELGVNHDGSLERALALTRAAAEAGADAVKLQLFRADLLMSRASRLAAYQVASGEQDPTAMLRRLEFSVERMAPIVALAHDLGIHAIVTVFSLELVGAAERLPWDAYKTASPDIVHKPLLDALAATGRPLIVSTGASAADEVGRALAWLRTAHDRLAVLQCVSAYPTPPDRAELGGISALRGLFGGVVGYSDHTAGFDAGAAAVRHGARMLEKHLTYDRRAVGPDHDASLEPAGLTEYVRRARDAVHEQATPDAADVVKRVLPIEDDVRRVSRQSIVSRRRLSRGHVVTREDVTFKRPGTGLLPFELAAVIGRVVARSIDADVPILPDDLTPSRADRPVGEGRAPPAM